jgi:hypothetical protein
MGPDLMSDTIHFSYHGYVTSHIDAVCHFDYKGSLYNGVPASSNTAKGCGKLGIEALKNGVITRVAIVGSDAATHVTPARFEGLFELMHHFLIAGLGVPILDALDLEAVARHRREARAMGLHAVGCADSRDRRNRWTDQCAGHFLRGSDRAAQS